MKHFLFLILLVSSAHISAQNKGFSIGYSLNHLRFYEASQANYCLEFNQGWKINSQESGQILLFSPTTDAFEIKQKCTYNRVYAGPSFAYFFKTQAVTNSFIYELSSNTAEGERQNLTTNETQTFSLKTKFNSFRYQMQYSVPKMPRLYINGSLGMHKYKLFYNYSSPNQKYEDILVGWRLKGLSRTYVPGSRKTVITLGTGLDFDIVKSKKIAIQMGAQYRLSTNAAATVDRGPYYEKMHYNLHSFYSSISAHYNL